MNSDAEFRHAQQAWRRSQNQETARRFFTAAKRMNRLQDLPPEVLRPFFLDLPLRTVMQLLAANPHAAGDERLMQDMRVAGLVATAVNEEDMHPPMNEVAPCQRCGGERWWLRQLGIFRDDRAYVEVHGGEPYLSVHTSQPDYSDSEIDFFVCRNCGAAYPRGAVDVEWE